MNPFLQRWFGDADGNGRTKTKEEAERLVELYDLHCYLENMIAAQYPPMDTDAITPEAIEVYSDLYTYMSKNRQREKFRMIYHKETIKRALDAMDPYWETLRHYRKVNVH